MNEFTINCTTEQTKRALALGAPISIKTEKVGLPNTSFGYNRNTFIIPTAEQMFGWLRGQGFRFDVEESSMCCITPHINHENHEFIFSPISGKNTAEAYLATIDVALEYLENKK